MELRPDDDGARAYAAATMPLPSKRRFPWTAWTTAASLAYGLAYAVRIAFRRDSEDLLWIPVVAGAVNVLVLIFVRVYRTDRRRPEELEWEAVRQREIERRHKRLALDPLPERHAPE
jgi:hypothetical protein